MEQKVSLTGISIVAGFALALGKLVAGSAMGSPAVLAGGIHSGLDLLAGVLSYFSVNQAKKPADEEHRYGHGKYENVAAVTETVLIIIAGVTIFYIAMPGVVQGGITVRYTELGIAVMGVSAAVNFLIAGMVSTASRKTVSPVFLAGRRHILVNAASSLVICAGLIAVRYTGVSIIDPLMALAVIMVLLKEGYGHLKISAGDILDERLPEHEEEIIRSVLSRHEGKFVQYHALRTRRAGREAHVDLHLVVPRDQQIAVTHEICDSIEVDVRDRLPWVDVLIHPEPCRPLGGECNNCGIERILRGESSGREVCSVKKAAEGTNSHI